jgi:hypothetical protein
MVLAGAGAPLLLATGFTILNTSTQFHLSEPFAWFQVN